MELRTSITGIILAGGKSSRMDHDDKAFLKLGSKNIIGELISRLENKFSRLVIIANDTKKYMRFGREVIKDILPGNGSLGGIYTGLIRSESFYNFIFACDAPFVDLSLIDYMINKANEADIIVPRWKERLEVLHAIYSKKCIGPIKRQLNKGDLKITNFFSEVSVKIIEEKELKRFNLGEESFFNINTPQEYQRITLR